MFLFVNMFTGYRQEYLNEIKKRSHELEIKKTSPLNKYLGGNFAINSLYCLLVTISVIFIFSVLFYMTGTVGFSIAGGLVKNVVPIYYFIFFIASGVFGLLCVFCTCFGCCVLISFALFILCVKYNQPKPDKFIEIPKN
jgi:hypothetical protein